MNFAKFLRTPFLTVYLRWLPLPLQNGNMAFYWLSRFVRLRRSVKVLCSEGFSLCDLYLHHHPILLTNQFELIGTVCFLHNYRKLILSFEFSQSRAKNQVKKCYTLGKVTLKAHSKVWDKFLASEHPLKKMKNAFYFTSKTLFVLKILKFLSCPFGHVAKQG